MANILYNKLQQAKEKFQEESSKLFSSFNNANLNKNKAKKISVIAYWLEILEDKIEECFSGEIVDPKTITYLLGTDLNLSNYQGTTTEYLYIRNKINKFVPIAKISVSTQLGSQSNWAVMQNDIYQTKIAGYNNYDNNISLKALTSPYRLELSFNSVGDNYNGKMLQSTNSALLVADKIIEGGVSPIQCNSFSTEETLYYDEILNTISIELNFNYSFSEEKLTTYNNTLNGDSQEGFTTQSGNPLEL
tara:strand:- start:678 stop:1418 length:741 start_codon:yes stop_codon:yes gene_type:complete